jgi:hypothetical protein
MVSCYPFLQALILPTSTPVNSRYIFTFRRESLRPTLLPLVQPGVLFPSNASWTRIGESTAAYTGARGRRRSEVNLAAFCDYVVMVSVPATSGNTP